MCTENWNLFDVSFPYHITMTSDSSLLAVISEAIKKDESIKEQIRSLVNQTESPKVGRIPSINQFTQLLNLFLCIYLR